ncbi:magnesium and cobalt transport protein CorA [Nakamurella leprariae]
MPAPRPEWTPLDLLARKHGDAAPTEPRPGTVVGCEAYIDGVPHPGCATPEAARQAIAEAGSGFVWIGLHEPTGADMQHLAEVFDLHELAVEDAVHAYQRPKLDAYRHSLFMVLKTVAHVDHATGLLGSTEVGDRRGALRHRPAPVGHTYAEADPARTKANSVEIVQTGEIMVFLGADFIITVRHGDHSSLIGLRQELESRPEHLQLGPAVVLHGITDRIVDEYFAVAEQIEQDMDDLETAVFSPGAPVSVERIYSFKREIMELRRAVVPLALPLRTLTNGSSPLVPDEVRRYFRDVEDHVLHVSEQIGSFDELLTNLANALLAEVGARQNEDMRKISSWAAIAVVPTAIAGIYGMNFDDMPELHWQYGYPAVLLLMFCLCFGIHRLLRRRGWL